MHHHYKVYSFSGDNWSIYFVSSPSTPLPIEYIQEFRFPWHNYFLPEFPFVSNFRNQMFKDIKWLLGSLTFCRRMPSWCFVPCASCPWNLSGKDPQIQSKLTAAMVICYPVTREFVFCVLSSPVSHSVGVWWFHISPDSSSPCTSPSPRHVSTIQNLAQICSCFACLVLTKGLISLWGCERTRCLQTPFLALTGNLSFMNKDLSPRA